MSHHFPRWTGGGRRLRYHGDPGAASPRLTAKPKRRIVEVVCTRGGLAGLVFGRRYSASPVQDPDGRRYLAVSPRTDGVIWLLPVDWFRTAHGKAMTGFAPLPPQPGHITLRTFDPQVS